MPRSSCPPMRRPAASGRVSAFTLMELVVVAAIGVGLLAAAVSIVLGNMRTTFRIGSLRHLQDHCGWVQFLINHEIEQSQSTSQLGGGLNLTVPGFADPTISYQVNGVTGELLRYGPPIDVHGRLEASNLPAAQQPPALVARDVQSFTVTVTNPRSPRYQLVLRDAAGDTYTVTQDDGRGGGAYCRARQITRTVTP